MTNDLLTRLLHLYPYQNTKEYFQGDEKTQAGLINWIIDNSQEPAIIKYCEDNFATTKKHVYFFNEIKNGINIPNDFEVLHSKTSVVGNIKTCFLILKAHFEISVISPYQELDFYFPWPIKIITSPKGIRVEFTILERKIDFYLNQNLEVIKSKQLTDESYVLQELMRYNGLDWTRKDLHKGIKKLWADGLIDALETNYKKSKSSAVETMDYSFTLKKAYPLLYAEIIKHELTKTNFCFVKNVSNYAKRFRIEPKVGKIAFPLYTDDVNLNENVMQKIIEKN